MKIINTLNNKELKEVITTPTGEPTIRVVDSNDLKDFIKEEVALLATNQLNIINERIDKDYIDLNNLIDTIDNSIKVNIDLMYQITGNPKEEQQPVETKDQNIDELNKIIG